MSGKLTTREKWYGAFLCTTGFLAGWQAWDLLTWIF